MVYCNGYPCICASCANNEERIYKAPGEAIEFCYTCDECSIFIGRSLGSKSHRITKCDNYKMSDRETKRCADAARLKSLKARKYTIGGTTFIVYKGGKQK